MRIDLNYMAKLKEKASPRLIYVKANMVVISKSIMISLPIGYKRVAFLKEPSKKGGNFMYMVLTNNPEGFLINFKNGSMGHLLCKRIGIVLLEEMGLELKNAEKISLLVGSEGMVVEGDYAEIWYEIINKPIERK